MSKTAWVFPGQGSQVLGMGVDLIDLPLAQQRFAEAEEILGWSVIEVCQHDEVKLGQTLFTQPCLYVVESIIADLLKEKSLPDFVAGHSLGEYIALYVAGVFAWSAGLRLVKRRAELMENAAGGMMAAMIKFDRDELERAISQIPDVVLANDNSPEQVVISGTPEAVKAVMENVKAKRAIPLNVSGAFHSPLMAAAAQEFQDVLAAVEFLPASIPVMSNVEPTPTQDQNVLKQRLMQQMTGSVRWREISLSLAGYGITRMVEVGPGNVLTGLIKRTCGDIQLENVRNTVELAQWGENRI